MAFLSFTYGHYAYEAGDDSATIGYMDKVAETNNSELQSLAFTYLALSEERLGHFRSSATTSSRPSTWTPRTSTDSAARSPPVSTPRGPHDRTPRRDPVTGTSSPRQGSPDPARRAAVS